MLKRRRNKLIFAIIFLLLGISLFIYPRITDKLYKDNVSKIEKEFDEKIEEYREDEKLEELYNLLVSENDKLYNNKQEVFLIDKDYDKTYIDLTSYGLDNNIFGFVEIPSINVNLPIYFGASNSNMRLGATHLTGTSYPIGGENTNSVIAAHRGYYKTEMFRNIDRIKIGDKLYIKNVFGSLEYVAYDMKVIKPDELSKLTINSGADMVSIVSCHPQRSNKLRYVVYFKRG